MSREPSSSQSQETGSVGDEGIGTPARGYRSRPTDERSIHRHNISSTSNSSNESESSSTQLSRSATRKRMSFTALPVVGSPVKSEPSTTPQRRRTTTTSGTSGQSPILRDASPIRDRPSSSNNALLAELAAKERKVVELRDEYKRIQQALRYAEADLKRFKDKARGVIEREQPYTLEQPHTRRSQEGEEDEVVERMENDEEKRRSSEGDRHLRPLDNAFGRVAAELNTQFWGLFEDIRNVAIGEDPREVPLHQRERNNNTSPAAGGATPTSKDEDNSYYLV